MTAPLTVMAQNSRDWKRRFGGRLPVWLMQKDLACMACLSAGLRSPHPSSSSSSKLDSPRFCEGVNTCGYTVPVKGRRGLGGEEERGGDSNSYMYTCTCACACACACMFIRPRIAMQSSGAIACIIFPSSHAAVGAYPRLDAVSSIIASSHSLTFLLLASFSPESAVAAFVSRLLSLSGDPCVFSVQ